MLVPREPDKGRQIQRKTIRLFRWNYLSHETHDDHYRCDGKARASALPLWHCHHWFVAGEYYVIVLKPDLL